MARILELVIVATPLLIAILGGGSDENEKPWFKPSTRIVSFLIFLVLINHELLGF